MAVKIEIHNVEKVIKKVNEYNARIIKRMQPALQKCAIYIRDKVAEDIARKQWSRADGTVGPSVDTSLFLNSIKFGIKGKNTASVFSDLPYASWLEYGTSRNNKKLYSGPRRHFGRIADQERHNVCKKFKVNILESNT